MRVEGAGDAACIERYGAESGTGYEHDDRREHDREMQPASGVAVRVDAYAVDGHAARPLVPGVGYRHVSPVEKSSFLEWWGQYKQSVLINEDPHFAGFAPRLR